MSSYAILGATGNTGRSLLQILLETRSSESEIHALVRSKAKLVKQDPSLERNPRVKIFEGTIDDIETLSSCITGTQAVFLVVAVSDNIPGCSIAQDTAHRVVEALLMLSQAKPVAKMPRLVVLSSASLDDHLCRDLPGFVHGMLLMASSHVYEDLRRAEKYLRSQSHWLSTTYMKPGGLSHDVRRGYKLSTDRSHTFVSFLDLAAAMAEIADASGDMWDMKSVSIVPKSEGEGAKFEKLAPVMLLKGLLWHFLPGLYAWFN